MTKNDESPFDDEELSDDDESSFDSDNEDDSSYDRNNGYNDNGESTDDSDESDDEDSDSDSDSDSDDTDSEYDEENAFENKGALLNEGLNAKKPPTGHANRIKPIQIILLSVCCLVLIIVAIGLGVGLSLKDDTDDPAVTAAQVNTIRPMTPSAPTNPPVRLPISFSDDDDDSTLALVDLEVIVPSTAETTIYRDGSFQDSTNGEENTILVQNGSPGDPEIAAAYSLVELSIDANEIKNIKDASAEFCLEHVPNDEPSDRILTYSVCLLIPTTDGEDSIETMTGATANYEMPNDCVDKKVVDFDVKPTDTTICMDVTSLIFGSASTSVRTLRGDGLNNDQIIRRSLQEKLSAIMMIDNLVQSDEPGDRFYTNNKGTKSLPTLFIEGKEQEEDISEINEECQTIAEIACSTSDFETLCELVKEANLAEALNSETFTVFAPTNDAFLKILDDVDLSDEAFVKDLLLYHTIPDLIVTSDDIVCEESVIMGNGKVTVTKCVGDDLFQVGNGNLPNALPRITKTDISACNGIVHVVDEVILPTDDGGDEINTCEPFDTIVCATPGLEALCQLIGSAALYSSGAVLLNSLKNDVYTVFAPNNNALENILSTVDISDIDTVVSILLYHAIPDIQISSNDVVEFCGSEVIMANGEAVTVDCRNDNIFVLGSGNKELRPKIVKTDIATCTGIIHIVNQVILSLNPENDPTTFPSVPSTTTDSELVSDSATEPKVTLTVVDTAIGDPDVFSSLVDFVTQADLVDALSSTNGITLFAPTNGAFAVLAEAAPVVVANLQTEEWQDHLKNLLEYHVLPVVVPSSAIIDGIFATTLNKEDITFSKKDSGIFVNSDAEVVAPDVDASDGVIHAIDNVLLPSWVSNSIVDLAIGSPDLSTLVDLVVQAGLVDTLSEAGPYTVFAPTNDAFLKLLGDENDASSLDDDLISSILTYHVVPGIYDSSSLVNGLNLTTVQGQDLTFSIQGNRKWVNGERIITPNILANNGIVHLVNGVLIPEESDTNEEVVNDPDVSSSQAEFEPCSLCLALNTELKFGYDYIRVGSIPDDVLAVLPIASEQTILECATIDEFCRSGNCSQKTCESLSIFGDDICGCNPII